MAVRLAQELGPTVQASLPQTLTFQRCASQAALWPGMRMDVAREAASGKRGEGVESRSRPRFQAVGGDRNLSRLIPVSASNETPGFPVLGLPYQASWTRDNPSEWPQSTRRPAIAVAHPASDSSQGTHPVCQLKENLDRRRFFRETSSDSPPDAKLGLGKQLAISDELLSA